MNLGRISAALAALVLGLGTAAACGGEDTPREQPSKGNQGQNVPEGTPATTETGPTTLESTGTQPTVTQPETGP